MVERETAFQSDEIYEDRGCHLHPSCLECPRAVCIYEDGDSALAARKVESEQRALRVFWSITKKKHSVKWCAEFYGISTDTVRRAYKAGAALDVARNKRRRHVASSVGLCSTCGTHEPRAGFATCEACSKRGAGWWHRSGKHKPRNRIKRTYIYARCPVCKNRWPISKRSGLMGKHGDCAGVGMLPEAE